MTETEWELWVEAKPLMQQALDAARAFIAATESKDESKKATKAGFEFKSAIAALDRLAPKALQYRTEERIRPHLKKGLRLWKQLVKASPEFAKHDDGVGAALETWTKRTAPGGDQATYHRWWSLAVNSLLDETRPPASPGGAFEARVDPDDISLMTTRKEPLVQLEKQGRKWLAAACSDKTKVMSTCHDFQISGVKVRWELSNYKPGGAEPDIWKLWMGIHGEPPELLRGFLN